MAATIDLRKFRQSLINFLDESVGLFAKDKPQELISTAILYVDPYGRASGRLCLDTLANSEKQVAESQHKGPHWYGEDEFGRYNDSPEDFGFFEFTCFEFADFPDLYHVGNPIYFIDHEGRTLDANRERNSDDGINRSMFPSLCAYVCEFVGWNPLRRSDIFRVGVVMHDSKRVAFWRYVEGH